jgi:hypothetical protein
LATGSGAVFSSAAFQSNVNPTADMRVVVEDDLIVEAGSSFRGSGGAYLSSPPGEKFYGTDNDGLFDGSESLGDVDIADLPAARVNDGTNGELYIQTAVRNRDESGSSTIVSFPNLLRVRNDGTETANVGITYQPTNEAYGEDVIDGGDVRANDVIEAYEFFNSGSKISPQSDYEAGPKNTVEVGVGETEQIGLEIDLSVGTIVEDIAEAASPGTEDVFNGGEYDTVQILDQIRVGNELSAGDS